MAAMHEMTGADIKEARERAGVTKLDLAAYLGWHRSTIWRYERDAVVPVDRAAAILRALSELAARPAA